MNHDRVCLFIDGSWCWNFEYSLKAYGHLGNYKEVILGQGWSDREVSQMLAEYYQENPHIFE
jgi:hypothetical protein